MLRSKPGENLQSIDVAPLSDLAGLRIGFLTNLLNPKATIFIVSLFMQVIRQDTPRTCKLTMVFSFLLFTLPGSQSLNFFSKRSVRDRLIAIRHWIDRIFGGLLVGFDIGLANAQGHRCHP